NRSNSVLIVAPHQESATTNSRSFHRFGLGLGTDLRGHGPPLSEEFVYLSLAAEIEPEGRRFAGTLESAGVFSHGVLRATRWFQGATLSSYSMGSPKPSVWTPSWRRTSKAINRRCALNVMIWAKTPPNVKVSAGSHRESTNVSSQPERYRMALKIRCSSASVLSSLCSIACGVRWDLGGPFISLSHPDSREGNERITHATVEAVRKPKSSSESATQLLQRTVTGDQDDVRDRHPGMRQLMCCP